MNFCVLGHFTVTNKILSILTSHICPYVQINVLGSSSFILFDQHKRIFLDKLTICWVRQKIFMFSFQFDFGFLKLILNLILVHDMYTLNENYLRQNERIYGSSCISNLCSSRLYLITFKHFVCLVGELDKCGTIYLIPFISSAI